MAFLDSSFLILAQMAGDLTCIGRRLGVVASLACPFCRRIAQGGVIASRALTAAFPFAYPIAHTLVVSRRHESDFFALDPEEQHELLVLATSFNDDCAKNWVSEG
jgi:hypothetical protein